jgi:uncharacterized membrane protein YkvA (DUF1232 family)
VDWWEAVAGVLGGLVLVWVALVVVLYVAGRREGDPTRLRDVLRLVPDVVRLFRRLAADPTLPRGVRVRMGLLAAYLVLPVDLVPDFIPVVGYADDALIVVWALRSVVRAAGADALDRHWPGTPEGLEALKRVARVPDDPRST